LLVARGGHRGQRDGEDDHVRNDVQWPLVLPARGGLPAAGDVVKSTYELIFRSMPDGAQLIIVMATSRFVRPPTGGLPATTTPDIGRPSCLLAKITGSWTSS
jgi:hypothetical protein